MTLGSGNYAAEQKGSFRVAEISRRFMTKCNFLELFSRSRHLCMAKGGCQTKPVFASGSVIVACPVRNTSRARRTRSSVTPVPKNKPYALRPVSAKHTFGEGRTREGLKTILDYSVDCLVKYLHTTLRYLEIR